MRQIPFGRTPKHTPVWCATMHREQGLGKHNDLENGCPGLQAKNELA